MPSPDSRAADIAARLSAVGLSPDVREDRDHTRIEARVPDSFPAEAWPEVVALLGTADWFGLADSSARGRTLWAAVRKGAAEAPTHQP